MNLGIMRMWKIATRRGALWALVISSVGVATFFGAQPLTIKYLAAQAIKTTPFTLKMEGYDYQFWPNGKRFLNLTVARRSDGSLAETSVNGFSKQVYMRKVTLADGDVFTIADKASVYVKWPLPAAEQIAADEERLRHLPHNCLSLPDEKIAGQGVILGHAVIALARQIADEKTTIWRAPDLACQALEVRTETLQPDGSYKLKAETKAVSLIVGEPDTSLFEVPATYSSEKPSDLLWKEYERIGAPWDDKVQRNADRLDAQYFSHLQAKSTPPVPAGSLSRSTVR